MRIGTAVSLLPLHSAIETAEQIAIVDLISNGRVDPGFGVGYRRPELRGIRWRLQAPLRPQSDRKVVSRYRPRWQPAPPAFPADGDPGRPRRDRRSSETSTCSSVPLDMRSLWRLPTRRSSTDRLLVLPRPDPRCRWSTAIRGNSGAAQQSGVRTRGEGLREGDPRTVSLGPRSR